MTFKFKRAERENIHVIFGMIGGTGSGKTYSALELATGLSGGKPFAFIDTEAGRAKHYADNFEFDHGDLTPPHDPSAYVEAITSADDAGYPVVVVDSMSHVWAGDGGVLDGHESELDRMAGQDWKKREACKMAAWIKPKSSHKKMVQKLLQLRCHLILCFRAEPKTKIVKESGKTKIIDIGWQPICEKNLPFELTASFLLSHETPGMPNNPLKLPDPLIKHFPPNQLITRKSGEAVAAWSSGATTAKPAPVASISDTMQRIIGAVSPEQLEIEIAAIRAGSWSDNELASLRETYIERKRRGF